MTNSLPAIPNPLAAILSFLLEQEGIQAIVSNRVYGESLPDEDINLMPRSCLVVAASPGYPSGSAMTKRKLYDLYVDVKCYGESAYEATQLFFVVHHYLIHLERKVQGNTLLHSVVAETSLTQLRDADGDWPLSFGTFIVLAALEPVS